MGVDLRLLPFDGDYFSHTVLSCDRTPDLFDIIRELPKRPIDGRFTSFVGDAPDGGEHCYGETITDPYGDQVCYVLAGELAGLECKDWKVGNNASILGYLKMLPWKTKVALYWH